MDLPLAFFRVLHIVLGTFWVGADVFATFLLIPRLRALGPDIERPVMGALMRVIPPAMMISSVVTAASGAVLIGSVRGWQIDWLFTTGWGWAMFVGFVLTVAAFVVGFGMLPPLTIRTEKLSRGFEGRAPSLEEGRELDRLNARITALARANSVFSHNRRGRHGRSKIRVGNREMKVFVFGGTGFIGGRVVARLVQGGHRVSALARSHEKAQFLERLGATPHIGDLQKPETIQKSIEGAQVIVNLAFPSFLGRSTEARVRRDRQQGLNQMRNLLETVAALGDVPVILTEGAMALGDSGDGWLDESSPHKFDIGHGKLLALSVPYAEKVVQEKGMPAITLIVGGAYGGGSWFRESVYELIRKGWFRIFGDGQNVWSPVHVDDVAEAYRLAVEKLPVGESFVVGDDEPCRFVDFANFVAHQMGKPPVKGFPKWVGTLLLGNVLCEALTMNTRLSNSKLKEQLGWKPRYRTYKEGIPAALAEIERP